MNTTSLDIERDLGLESIVSSWVLNPQRWEHLVRFAEPRVRIPLFADDEVEVRLLTWLPGQGSGLHDHGGSSGCIQVVSGNVHEVVVDVDGTVVESCYQAGQASSFQKDIIHAVRNADDVPAVTIHAYRPPTHEAHRYELVDGRRTTLVD